MANSGSIINSISSTESTTAYPRNTCPICLTRLSKCELGRPDNCNHVFCLPCIQEWSKNVNTCPVDRKKFSEILVYGPRSSHLLRKIHVPNRRFEDTLIDPNDVTFCEVCSQSSDENVLLLCDGCDKGYHTYCLTPPLTGIPEGNWYCSLCHVIVTATSVAMDDQDDSDTSSDLCMDSEDENDFIGRKRGRGVVLLLSDEEEEEEVKVLTNKYNPRRIATSPNFKINLPVEHSPELRSISRRGLTVTKDTEGLPVKRQRQNSSLGLTEDDLKTEIIVIHSRTPSPEPLSPSPKIKLTTGCLVKRKPIGRSCKSAGNTLSYTSLNNDPICNGKDDSTKEETCNDNEDSVLICGISATTTTNNSGNRFNTTSSKGRKVKIESSTTSTSNTFSSNSANGGNLIKKSNSKLDSSANNLLPSSSTHSTSSSVTHSLTTSSSSAHSSNTDHKRRTTKRKRSHNDSFENPKPSCKSKNTSPRARTVASHTPIRLAFRDAVISSHKHSQSGAGLQEAQRIVKRCGLTLSPFDSLVTRNVAIPSKSRHKASLSSPEIHQKSSETHHKSLSSPKGQQKSSEIRLKSSEIFHKSLFSPDVPHRPSEIFRQSPAYNKVTAKKDTSLESRPLRSALKKSSIPEHTSDNKKETSLYLKDTSRPHITTKKPLLLTELPTTTDYLGSIEKSLRVLNPGSQVTFQRDGTLQPLPPNDRNSNNSNESILVKGKEEKEVVVAVPLDGAKKRKRNHSTRITTGTSTYGSTMMKATNDSRKIPTGNAEITKDISTETIGISHKTTKITKMIPTTATTDSTDSTTTQIVSGISKKTTKNTIGISKSTTGISKNTNGNSTTSGSTTNKRKKKKSTPNDDTSSQLLSTSPSTSLSTSPIISPQSCSSNSTRLLSPNNTSIISDNNNKVKLSSADSGPPLLSSSSLTSEDLIDCILFGELNAVKFKQILERQREEKELKNEKEKVVVTEEEKRDGSARTRLERKEGKRKGGETKGGLVLIKESETGGTKSILPPNSGRCFNMYLSHDEAIDTVKRLVQKRYITGDIDADKMETIKAKAIKKVQLAVNVVPHTRVQKLVDDYITSYSTSYQQSLNTTV